MDELLNSSTQSGDEIQKDDAGTQNWATQAPQITVPEEDYKNIQAFGTQNRQALIETTKKLVMKDSSELHAIKDEKLRDAVTKATLNMTYAEATAVLGSNFSLEDSQENPKGDSDKGDEPASGIERELRLMRHRETQREIDSSIGKIKAENPAMFDSEGKLEERIRDELSNISSNLPHEERVWKALNIAIGSPLDTKSLAYKILNSANAGNPSGVSGKERNEKQTKTHQLTEELRALWWLKK